MFVFSQDIPKHNLNNAYGVGNNGMIYRIYDSGSSYIDYATYITKYARSAPLRISASVNVGKYIYLNKYSALKYVYGISLVHYEDFKDKLVLNTSAKLGLAVEIISPLQTGIVFDFFYGARLKYTTYSGISFDTFSFDVGALFNL
jgi:hypothetical protein